MRLAEELKRNEKERAEHVMLVDLGRNDVGRVCDYGSVRVPQFMGLERFSHVMHLTSIVEGRLSGDRDRLDALVSCFPAGTVSGAPKVRAMQLIAAAEGERRGLYGGAVGYLGYDGNLDTAITIRSAMTRRTAAMAASSFGCKARTSVPYATCTAVCTSTRGSASEAFSTRVVIRVSFGTIASRPLSERIIV